MVTAVVHFWSLIYQAKYLTLQNFSINLENPQLISFGFATASSVSALISTCFYYKLVWTKQKHLLTITVQLTHFNSKRQSKFWECAKISISILLVGFHYLDWLTLLTDSQASQVTQALEKLNASTSKLDFAWKLFSYLWDSHCQSMLFSVDVFLLVISCTLLIESSYVQKRLSVFNGKSIGLILQMRENVNFINEIMGNNYLVFYIAVLTYSCELPQILLETYFQFAPAVVFAFFVVDLSVLIVTAEFHWRLNASISNWFGTTNRQSFDAEASITNNGETNKAVSVYLLTPHQLKMELYHEPIAISCRFFTATYTLVASVSKFIAIMLLTFG